MNYTFRQTFSSNMNLIDDWMSKDEIIDLLLPRHNIEEPTVESSTVFTGKYHPGLKYLGKNPGYGCYQPPGRYDEWVHQALKKWDPVLHGRLKDSTRKHAGMQGMYESLAEFSTPDFSNIPPKNRECLELAIQDAQKAFKLPEPVIPISMEAVADEMEGSTSAGYSFPGKKKSLKLSIKQKISIITSNVS